MTHHTERLVYAPRPCSRCRHLRRVQMEQGVRYTCDWEPSATPLHVTVMTYKQYLLPAMIEGPHEGTEIPCPTFSPANPED